jgi:hypothetical protein
MYYCRKYQDPLLSGGGNISPTLEVCVAAMLLMAGNEKAQTSVASSGMTQFHENP